MIIGWIWCGSSITHAINRTLVRYSIKYVNPYVTFFFPSSDWYHTGIDLTILKNLYFAASFKASSRRQNRILTLICCQTVSDWLGKFFKLPHRISAPNWQEGRQATARLHIDIETTLIPQQSEGLFNPGQPRPPPLLHLLFPTHTHFYSLRFSSWRTTWLSLIEAVIASMR